MAFESTFEANPGVEKLYGFEDGNAFINIVDADVYAKKTKQAYKEINKEQPKQTTKTK